MLKLNYTWLLFFIFMLFLFTIIFILIALDHFIITLIFLDLLLLCNILLLIMCTQFTGNVVGYNYALLLLGVAAADTAVGLGLFILYFKTTALVSIKL